MSFRNLKHLSALVALMCEGEERGWVALGIHVVKPSQCDGI